MTCKYVNVHEDVLDAVTMMLRAAWARGAFTDIVAGADYPLRIAEHLEKLPKLEMGQETKG